MKNLCIPLNLKFEDVIWFDTLGVVKCRDKYTKETKIFVGKGLGENEKYDVERIINLGTKYSADEFIKLVEWLVK